MTQAARQLCARVGIVLATLLTPSCERPSQRPLGYSGWGPQADFDPAEAPSVELPPAPRPEAIPEAERKRWEGADAIATLIQVPGRGPSEHGANLERRVLVDQGAEAYLLLASAQPFSPGATIVQQHYAPDAETPSSTYVMVRGDDGWRFLVLDRQLRVATSGPLEPCRRCHADAPFDGLFGPPDGD